MNRRMVLGVALALGVAAAGGCVPPSPGLVDTVVASKAPQSPRDRLMAALPELDGPGFAYQVEDTELPYSGVVQPADRSYTIGIRQKDRDLGFTMSMDFLVVDKQAWLKVVFSHTEGLTGLPKLPRTWMLLDPKKVSDDEKFPLAYEGDTDPGNASVIFQSIVDVRETGPGRFAGTVDLTREPDADLVDAKRLAALGAKAKVVPFEAVVDAAGRLTSTVVKVPATGRTKASRYAVSYHDYGTAPKVQRPARGEQAPAPAAAYEMMNV